jgi:hypothetical protein
MRQPGHELSVGQRLRTGGGGPSSSQDLNWRFEQGDLIWLKSVPLLWSILFTTQFAANTTQLFFWGKGGRAGPKIAGEK